jgi:hypothetical protein
MNLYNLHDKPKDLHRHDDADAHVVEAFWDKYENNPKELKKREPAIAKDAEYSYYYANVVLKGRFELGEPEIAKDSGYSYYYARDALKRRFELGEPGIAKDAEYSYYYARDVIKGRFELGELEIRKSKHYRDMYNKTIKSFDSNHNTSNFQL